MEIHFVTSFYFVSVLALIVSRPDMEIVSNKDVYFGCINFGGYTSNQCLPFPSLHNPLIRPTVVCLMNNIALLIGLVGVINMNNQ